MKPCVSTGNSNNLNWESCRGEAGSCFSFIERKMWKRWPEGNTKREKRGGSGKKEIEHWMVEGLVMNVWKKKRKGVLKRMMWFSTSLQKGGES